ncbi:unnamed protein product [Linum tenue]|uniref:Uncharacterized protein n=1 Tax=Linum tenue TaxID=586396 RepID=A0AAV0JYZ8_9ROSI|nr:unnamed protein product [Linum tenue]
MLSAAIYHKQLKLSTAAKASHSSGEIVNYVTADAYRIGEFPYWFHQIWTTTIQLCLALVIIYSAVGLATAAAVLAILLVVLPTYPMIKWQHKYQTNLMSAQDKRLKAISEALANMKVLKLYAWEKHFRNVIQGLRNEEFEWISGVLSVKGLQMVLFWTSPVLVPAITFWASYLLGIPLTASNVFTTLASLRLLQEPIRLIPDVVGVFIEAKVSLDRIVRFLEAPELLNVKVYGKIAYVSQAAWIQTGTIQCSLVKDLEMLPYGDLTQIGERGVNLSGGQKQRVQLARALYQNADVYLLDDPFSAVDAHTATNLFNEYVMEALAGKTVLLVTHQVDFLPSFDSILIQDPKISKVNLLAVYSAIGGIMAAFLLVRSWLVVKLGCVTSESIFSNLLVSLFRAPMSFYDSTPLGRILSRVSADMSLVDLEMAFKSTIAVGSTMNAYSIFAVLAFITWPVLFVIIPLVYLIIILQVDT